MNENLTTTHALVADAPANVAPVNESANPTEDIAQAVDNEELLKELDACGVSFNHISHLCWASYNITYYGNWV